MSNEPTSHLHPGQDTDAGLPVLHVHSLPPEIRHGAVIGAFESLRPGRSLVIVAPHDPVPLLTQLRERGEVDVDYLQSGPTEWTLKLTRG